MVTLISFSASPSGCSFILYNFCKVVLLKHEDDGFSVAVNAACSHDNAHEGSMACGT